MSPTAEQLFARAKEMGHELTDTLQAELTMLAAVSDDELKAALDDVRVKRMAKEFEVVEPAMRIRLEGMGIIEPRRTGGASRR